MIIILWSLLVAAGGGFAWWWFNHDGNGNGPLVLYGNVDLRQVDLAFNDSGARSPQCWSTRAPR